MWVVAKVNIQEVNTFKRKLIEKFGKEIEFYNPKIVYYKNFKNKIKKFEKFILENYIFCHHRKFANSNAINEIQFIKGLQYFLTGHIQNHDLLSYIRRDKKTENRVLNFVVLENLGKATTTTKVSEDLIEKSLKVLYISI